MNEFKNLIWRVDATDSELEKGFLSEEAISSLYTYKSLGGPIKVKKHLKLHCHAEKYVPGLTEYRPIKRRSLLTKLQKFQCLQALKLIQSGKRQDLLTQNEKHCLKIFTACQSKILEENQLFNEFVRNDFNKLKKKHNKIAPGLFTFAWTYWKQNLNRYFEYPQFYKELSLIGLNFDDSESTIDFQHLVQPLEIGTLARYTKTSLKEKCILKINTLKLLGPSEILNSRLSVSQDENIVKLSENHNFDVAISSSALKQLIDFSDTKSKWLIPVVIKTINGKKIVFIDKVLPKTNPTHSDFNLYSFKRLLKLHFCQYEAFSYPEQETPITQLTATEDCDQNCKVIHHNVNYRIWSIKKTIQNSLVKNLGKDCDIKLLIRCKLDACESTEQGALVPVIIRPKLEHQIPFGVKIASKSELSRDWTSLFFRLYSVLYRSRINSSKKELITIEKCSIQKINTEAHTHFGFKPILGLGVLQKILAQLTQLEVGDYLLQHLPKHESFVAVMKRCEGDENCFDLHEVCSQAGVDRTTEPNWLPVDVNYLLPAHEESNTIPGLFDGFDQLDTNGKPIRGKKKKVKKK